MLRIDKSNETRDSGKDTDKGAGSKNAPRGNNMSNASNVKWAKGTKEGNMGSKVSK